MKKIIFLGLLGLVIGYGIFARSGGEFIPVLNLITPPQNALEEMTQTLTGLKKIRQNILIAGAVGAGLGLVWTLKKD